MSEPTWRRGKAGDTVQLPAWFFANLGVRWGVVRADALHDVPTTWTHWMPRVNDDVPNPPNELDVETTSRAGCVEPGDRIRETLYSPARIQILLWCAVRPEPLPNFDAPVSVETIQEFLQLGVIEPYGPIEPGPQQYRATKLGRAWVQALCNVSIPRVVYLDAAGNAIDVR